MPRGDTERAPVVLAPGGGRRYDMGRIQAIFKANGPETANRYSISEWWLEPNTTGPGAHAHPEDDIFYVIEGTMTVLVADRRIDAPKGSFVLVPGGTTHDFENRGATSAGVLNFSYPGDFEQHARHRPVVRRQPPDRSGLKHDPVLVTRIRGPARMRVTRNGVVNVTAWSRRRLPWSALTTIGAAA